MTKINFGKRFEDDFRTSVPDYCDVHRLRDSGQSFVNSNDTKFSWQNECDFKVFDDRNRLLYAVENKSTQYKSMNWESEEEYELNKSLNKKSTKLIKWHQIQSLIKFNDFKHIIPCFVLNFRNIDSCEQRTYFIHIKDFVKMINTVSKKSFDEINLIQNGAIKIQGRLKRTRYTWDLDEFLSKYSTNYNH